VVIVSVIERTFHLSENMSGVITWSRAECRSGSEMKASSGASCSDGSWLSGGDVRLCVYCRYTYGQPVSGHADVYISLLYSHRWNTPTDAPHKHYHVTVCIWLSLLLLLLLLW